MPWLSRGFSIRQGGARPDGSNTGAAVDGTATRWLVLPNSTQGGDFMLSVEMWLEESPVFRGSSDIGLVFGYRNDTSFGFLGFRHTRNASLELVLRDPASGTTQVKPVSQGMWPLGMRAAQVQVECRATRCECIVLPLWSQPGAEGDKRCKHEQQQPKCQTSQKVRHAKGIEIRASENT